MRAWLKANRTALVIAAMTAAGFALTLYVFYPGIMTFDAFYIHKDMTNGTFGDWQSPAMLALWSLIDPIAPGMGSMLILTVALYWLTFAIAALAIAQRSPQFAVLLPLLALSPPAFILVGVIWRDILFAIVWMLGAVAVFAVTGRDRKLLIPVQIAAFGLFLFGVLLRPNALVAAPILAAYIAWPHRFSWKRTVLLYAPIAFVLFGVVHVVYYGVFNAKREHPLHSIMVFDLGGISHFAKENVFPGTWTTRESNLITDGCYKPIAWDIYWTQQPCLFVMERLEGENLFGQPALAAAWRHAVVSHPIAYLEHRAVYFWTFLAGENLAMWSRDLDDPDKIIFADKPRLMAVKAINDALLPTPLFRTGTWLLLNIAGCLFAWRRRNSPAGAFALAICGSAVVYILTFLAVGVSTDLRYAYWAIMTGLVGTMALVQKQPVSAELPARWWRRPIAP